MTTDKREAERRFLAAVAKYKRRIHEAERALAVERDIYNAVMSHRSDTSDRDGGTGRRDTGS